MKKKVLSAKVGRTTPEFFSADVAKARRFYLDLNPPRNRQLVVVCGGLEHCTPDYAVQRATFPFYSIEYVVCGSGQVTLKGRTHALQSGCLFAYGPRIPHQITGNPRDPLVKYFVDFAGTRAVNLLRSCNLPPGHFSKVFSPNALQPLFDELVEAGLGAQRESGVLCAKLVECLALRIAGARTPHEGGETHAFATYRHCRQYIEHHYLELRTLKQIAVECHLDPAYLCRLFRQYDNLSPYQYMRRLKMNHAAARLQEPGALVKQVAAECGFADQFHFSRVFTSVFGLSPTAFRGLR